MIRLPSICPPLRRPVFNLISFLALTLTIPLYAQPDPSIGDIGSCTLKNHVYTCNRNEFEKAFTATRNVAIETHNIDASSRTRLADMLTKKYGKNVVASTSSGAEPELIFLIIPLGHEGVNVVPGEVELGTLRVYSSTPGGARGHLVWAETYTGEPDLPWPAVSRALLLQFQSHFHPK
jgi:hypothetical protein